MLEVAALTLLLVLGAPPSPSFDPPPPPSPKPDKFELVRVIVPDRDNLQFLALWIARGAGLFRDEGLETELALPRDPSDTARVVREGRAPFAILPPPVYLKLIAERAPIVLTLNLLANDPIDLVATPKLLEARKISATTPLRQRLLALKGLKIGIAPHPPVRLRTLFRSAGLDVADILEQVTLPGTLQVEAFKKGEVDLLYSHTPYLERALLDSGGVILVNQTRGEVPELSGRQIHVVSATREMVKTRPDLVARFTRAMHRAMVLARNDRPGAARAILAEFPEGDRRSVELTLELYTPALPVDPRITVAGIKRALSFVPTEGELPKISGIDLRPYVWTAPPPPKTPPKVEHHHHAH